MTGAAGDGAGRRRRAAGARRYAAHVAVGAIIATVNLGLVPAPLAASPAHDEPATPTAVAP